MIHGGIPHIHNKSKKLTSNRNFNWNLHEFASCVHPEKATEILNTVSEPSCRFHKTERKSNRPTSNWRSVSAAQWWWCGRVFFAKHTTTLLLSDSLPQCSSVYTRKHYWSLPTPYELLKHSCPMHATERHSKACHCEQMYIKSSAAYGSAANNPAHKRDWTCRSTQRRSCVSRTR